ncbi:MAG: hypothetical protein LBI69_03155 [Puniceicoccales bacterium]|jgi:hypothetical protein|nr:hypothetical protein [Puniceicoccales bacterium]
MNCENVELRKVNVGQLSADEYYFVAEIIPLKQGGSKRFKINPNVTFFVQFTKVGKMDS